MDTPNTCPKCEGTEIEDGVCQNCGYYIIGNDNL